MNKEEAIRQECLLALAKAEEIVADMRALRDAANGARREDLDKRLERCEHVLEEMREGMREVEYQSFRADLQRTLDQL